MFHVVQVKLIVFVLFFRTFFSLRRVRNNAENLLGSAIRFVSCFEQDGCCFLGASELILSGIDLLFCVSSYKSEAYYVFLVFSTKFAHTMTQNKF